MSLTKNLFDSRNKASSNTKGYVSFDRSDVSDDMFSIEAVVHTPLDDEKGYDVTRFTGSYINSYRSCVNFLEQATCDILDVKVEVNEEDSRMTIILVLATPEGQFDWIKLNHLPDQEFLHLMQCRSLSHISSLN